MYTIYVCLCIENKVHLHPAFVNYNILYLQVVKRPTTSSIIPSGVIGQQKKKTLLEDYNINDKIINRKSPTHLPF